MPTTIKDAIQQKKFRNVNHQAQVNLIYTSNWLQNQIAKIFKKYGLSSQQYNVLRILNGSHPNSLNLSQIKSRMLDKMSDTSRVVERLRLSGYLTRVPSKEDRRESIITISKKGLKLVEEMKIEEVSMDQISKGLTATEAAQLCKLLDKFRRDELND
ncbi:MAG: MarR family transcriptional regulator [Bacteroidia bacterium]|jgi:DNA-binding MarR family transcriptional regulator|nr:MarR family transcriptional regulator [Bacteroidota bacterium]MBP7244188.1 MarR family transcriptional regulator [Bacteroidia bacterium]